MSGKNIGFPEKLFFSLFLASLIIRVIFIFLVSDNPTNFAPDEATYSSLTNWIYEKKELNEFPNFGTDLYLISRALILPSVWLMHLGFSALAAVRVISNLYSLLSIIVFYGICRNLADIRIEQNPKFRKVYLLVGLIFTFLPSHFLWGVLALRESVAEFWVLTTILIFIKLIIDSNLKTDKRLLVLLPVSIILLFQARPQVAWVVSVALIIATMTSRNNFKKILIIGFLLFAVLIGWQSTTTWLLKIESSKLSTIEISVAQKELTEENNAINRNPLRNFTNNITSSSQANLDRQIGAESKIESFHCPFKNHQGDFNVGCYILNAPRASVIFMLGPSFVINEVSGFAKLAAIENLCWLGLIVLFLVNILNPKKKSNLRPPSIFAIFLVLVGYVVGASAVEGNMGTAFRHKSLTLWAILLLILMLNKSKLERD